MLSSVSLMFIIEFLSIMKTIPMPMLKARYISSSSTLPKFCKTLNNPSFGQVSFLILTEQLSGRIRGIFSVRPPPVICATPFISMFLKS